MKINNIEHFKKLVKDGKIKDKWYFYKRSEKTKDAQTNEILWLINYFKQKLNLILYPISGTLLGIMRNKDFIEHDNDVDLAYLSTKNNKQDVLNEFYNICNILEKENLLAKICTKGQLHCFGKSKTFKYDIWTSFFIDSKYYLVPLINGELSSTILLPLKNGLLRNNSILIPTQSELLLDFIYLNWKTPNFNLGNKIKWKKIL